ncbi:Protein transport protein sec1 [Smittium culicis]|uniref:Protein transport protein sec1 n=1 Tax=Smittium culicis TaxID=133412 RepID=A0A1R1Y1U0_9FUNG|nr:Protein transport protein sec1 [Smittium culicis]
MSPKNNYKSVIDSFTLLSKINKKIAVINKPKESNTSLFDSESENFDLSRYKTVLSYILRNATADLLDPYYFSPVSQGNQGVKNIGIEIRNISSVIIDPIIETFTGINKKKSSGIWSRSPTWQKKIRNTENKGLYYKKENEVVNSKTNNINGSTQGSIELVKKSSDISKKSISSRWSKKSKNSKKSGKSGKSDRSSNFELKMREMFNEHKIRFNKVDSAPQIVVFILGGVTYPEIRDVNLLSKNYKTNIYIGSTHLITPSDFIKQLGL